MNSRFTVRHSMIWSFPNGDFCCTTDGCFKFFVFNPKGNLIYGFGITKLKS